MYADSRPMKASELIERLQDLIKIYGDQSVYLKSSSLSCDEPVLEVQRQFGCSYNFSNQTPVGSFLIS